MFGKVRKKKVFTRIVSMILAVVFFATNVVMALPGYSFAEDLAEGGESAVETQETGTQSRVFDDTKIDVWDFGAENLGDEFNNRLDEETINGFYSVAPGTTGVNIASFSPCIDKNMARIFDLPVFQSGFISNIASSFLNVSCPSRHVSVSQPFSLSHSESPR